MTDSSRNAPERGPLTTRALRSQNAEFVLECLAGGDAMTRAELSEVTSLTPQALGPILSELVDEGRVITSPSTRARPGRRPAEFRLNPRGSVGLTAFMRYANIHYQLTDAGGTSIGEGEFRVGRKRDPGLIVERLAEAVRELASEHKITIDRIEQITLTVEGRVDHEGGNIPDSAIWKATNVDMHQLLTAHFKPDVDIRLFSHEHALAHFALATIDPDPSDLVAVLLISHDNHLLFAQAASVLNNRFGDSGELTHFPVQGNDKLCPCGKVGCLGTVASGRAVVEYYLELTGVEVDAAVDVIERIGKGEAAAIEAANRNTDWLARTIAPMLELVRPDRLVLSGAVGASDRHGTRVLVEAIRRHLSHPLSEMPIDAVPPRFSSEALAVSLLASASDS